MVPILDALFQGHPIRIPVVADAHAREAPSIVLGANSGAFDVVPEPDRLARERRD